MNKQVKICMGIFLILVLTLSLASAMTVKSVNANNFQPGSEQDITIKIKNTLNEDVKDVSLNLNMASLPFSITNSGNNVDEMLSDDSESFDFKIKASNSANAGDYSVPYTLVYTLDNETQPTTKTGTIMLTVEANPELVYSVSADNPVVGSKGKIKLNIVNQGLGDSKFVSVTVIPVGYTLLSGDNEYIGTISSDDSQSINFDVIFNQQNPTLSAKIEYKNFDNELKTENINLPIKVYSKEEALKLGLINPDNSFTYIIGLGIIITSWIVIRKIRKKRRLNKAQGR